MHGVIPHPLHDLLIPALFVVILIMNCSGFQPAFRHCRGEYTHELACAHMDACQAFPLTLEYVDIRNFYTRAPIPLACKP